MDKNLLERVEEAHAHHQEHIHGDLPWRAWGSWFSWGSPIGLGMGWTLFILPLGVFLWILHTIGLLH